MPHIEKLRKALVGNESHAEMRFSIDPVLSIETASTFIFWSSG